tara:strand:- start:9471 stop:9869 length:399 start_codon:yes stop_codon:yes gene_type:complete
MPSPRKRIGFLPGVEIQDIIDRICAEENLSQSKVTGLLVEEALKRRGLYKPKIGKQEFVKTLTNVIFSDNVESKNNTLMSNDFNNEVYNKDFENKRSVKDVSYTRSEYELLKDYLEYKRFKYMMKRAKEEEA